MKTLHRSVRTAVAVAVLALAMPTTADATTFICTSQNAYGYEKGSGALTTVSNVWPRKWTFNDVTGLLDYGQTKIDKLTVTSRGSTVSANYEHNGAIHSAIDIRIYKSGVAKFVWLKGGNVLLLTGTCELIGDLPSGSLWED